MLKYIKEHKYNIIKTISIINLFFVILNVINLVIASFTKFNVYNLEQSHISFGYIGIFIISIFLFLNIILLINMKQKNYIIYFICIVIICLATPISTKTTFHKYEYKKNSNTISPIGFVSDNGEYQVEHYTNIYGIDIWQISHKPYWAE